MFEAFLDSFAPFSPPPLCPELRAFCAASLVEVWEAAERLAGHTLPSPFWAFPWPAGIALARVILDEPALVAGKSVIDVGAGGGISCLAAARAGARRVVACDVDPWALATTRLAARRLHVSVEVLQEDAARRPAMLDGFEVVLCGDLAYDRAAAAQERQALVRAAAGGATLLIADAGRTWFDATGLQPWAEFRVPVVADLEGRTEALARVFLVTA